MCGRYALALRPSQVRAYLENENMPVWEAPEDDADNAPRHSYNFAPGYNGIIYRADTPYWGAGPRSHKKGEGDLDEPAIEPGVVEAAEEQGDVRYKLQSMKWGLIPFWTKRNPDYASMLRTINCRDDSLIENRGMWTTMKQKKRCIVIAQGFYEWLKKGKDKVPHYVKRKDGLLMCWAGLWDCVQYEGSDEKTWTYTVITTSSNKQLNFLHDRMPVIFENGSEEIRKWLDPKRSTWSKDLQSLLVPFGGELEIYPVSKDVGKVGNNSPTFIVPVASSENKSNIANFFAKGAAKKDSKEEPTPNLNAKSVIIKVEDAKDEESTSIKHESEESTPLFVPELATDQGVKRGLDDTPNEEQPRKVPRTFGPSKTPSPSKPVRNMKSATSNNTSSPKKVTSKDRGSQKITSFFAK